MHINPPNLCISTLVRFDFPSFLLMLVNIIMWHLGFLKMHAAHGQILVTKHSFFDWRVHVWHLAGLVYVYTWYMSLLLILDVHLDVDKIIFLSPPVTYTYMRIFPIGLILHPHHVSSQESRSFVSPSKDMSIYFLMQPSQTILKYSFFISWSV